MSISKPTTMPWLPVMPVRWSETRAKNLFRKENRPVREEDDVVTCFRDGIVTLRKNRRTTGFTESTQWSGYQGVRKETLSSMLWTLSPVRSVFLTLMVKALLFIAFVRQSKI